MAPVLSMIIGAVMAGTAGSVRTTRRVAVPSEIDGVPVYNNHMAFDASRWGEEGFFLEQAVLDSGKEHFIAMVKEGISESDLLMMCVSHAVCESHGSGAGVPFLELKASLEDLRAFVSEEKSKLLFVEPTAPFHVTGELPSIQTETPWGLNRIRGRSGISARPKGPGVQGEGVNAYVLDTGIRTTHHQFEGRAISAADATAWFGLRVKECHGQVGCAGDVQGHGTHCAGTIGGKDYGVADAVTLRAVKVLGDNGGGSNFGIINALDWVASKGIRPAVASMSLGGGKNEALNVAVNEAVKKGIVVVTAAGNENTDGCTKSPGSATLTINVGATDSKDRRAVFSNYGTCLDIYAPGVDILSSIPTSDTSSKKYSGTSMACPHVSGVAALVMAEIGSDLTPAGVKTAILEVATPGVVQDAKPGSPNLLLFTEL